MILGDFNISYATLRPVINYIYLLYLDVITNFDKNASALGPHYRILDLV